jgi:hypothetical protein
MFRRLKLAFISVTALAAFATSAYANAIYTWVPASGPGNPTGSLSITDDAYFAGSATFALHNLDNPIPQPESDIVSFSFFLPWRYGSARGPDRHIQFRRDCARRWSKG